MESNYAAAAKSLQSCPTLLDSIVGRPPGSSVPGILQARILEWVAKNEATVSANHVNLAVISLQSKRSGGNEGSFIVPLKNTGESALPRGH